MPPGGEDLLDILGLLLVDNIASPLMLLLSVDLFFLSLILSVDFDLDCSSVHRRGCLLYI